MSSDKASIQPLTTNFAETVILSRLQQERGGLIDNLISTGSVNAHQLGRYTYVLNSPTNYTDGSGHANEGSAAGEPDGAMVAAGILIVAAIIIANNAEEVGDAIGDAIEDATNDPAPAESSEDSPNAEGDNWEVGEPIDKPDSDGNYPSWKTVRERYWKTRAATASEGEFSEQNLGRMRRGLAPVARVRVINKDGEEEIILVSKELHHINGRDIPNPHAAENLQELWPWEHAEIDPDRYTGYEFVEFVGNTGGLQE